MNDTILWQRWQAERDPEAFGELLSRHSKLVFNTCRRILGNAADAEDVAQECFLELLRGRVRVVENLAPLLHVLALRRSRDSLKRDRRRRAREERFSAERRPARDPALEDLTRLVDEAIAELPEELRIPLVHRYLTGETNEAIALRLGIAESTVRHRVQKGVERVRRTLTRRGVTVSAALVATFLESMSLEAAPAALIASLGKAALGGSALASLAARGALLTGALALKKITIAVGVALLLLTAWTVLSPFARPARQLPPGAGAPPNLAVIEREAVPEAGDPAAAGEGEKAAATDLLAKSARIAGIVRDAETGEPLAGVRIASGELAALSDATGRFALEGVAAGPARLAAAREGFVPLALDMVVGESPPPEQDLALAPALEVFAVDESGKGVSGVQVYLSETSVPLGGGSSRSATAGPYSTGENGRAFFPDVVRRPPGLSYWQRVIFAWEDGEPPRIGLGSEHFSRPVEGEAPPYPETPLRVTLGKSMPVAGDVRVPPGYAPRQVVVQLQGVSLREPRALLGTAFDRQEGGRTLWPEVLDVHPDAGGHFELTPVPYGAHARVVAEGPGLGRAQFASDEPGALGKIVLSLSTEGAIEGTLAYRLNGSPAGGWTLAASAETHADGQGFKTVTDDLGRFRFDGLPAAAYSVALPYDADRSGGTLSVTTRVQVRSGEVVRGLRLLIEQGAAAQGRITNLETGEPVEGVQVRALQGTSDFTVPVGDAATGENGEYVLRLPSGTSRLYLTSIPKGFRRPPEPEEHVVELAIGDAGRSGLDFLLTPGEDPPPAFIRAFLQVEDLGRAAGRVVDLDGRPLEGVSIEAHRQWHLEKAAKEGTDRGPWANPTHRTHSDAEGRYQVQVAAEKPYKILATGTEYGDSWSEVFEVAKDKEHAVEQLEVAGATSELQGEVMEPRGRPVQGAELHASSDRKGSSRSQPVTDAEGRFHVRNLIDGEPVRLVVIRAGYQRGEWFVAPDTSDLRLVLHPDQESGPEKPDRPASPPVRGTPSPAWEVEQWVRMPPAPARPDRGDGRSTALVLARAPSSWESLWTRVAAIADLCERRGAVAVLILSPDVHESLVRPQVDRLSPALGAAIDRFVPGSGSYSSGATSLAFGQGSSHTVYVIDPEGTVIQAFRGLEKLSGIEAALAK